MFALVGAAATALYVAPPAAPEAVANPNTRIAGRLANGILTISLDAVDARWNPEGADSPLLDFPAFAESGRAPSIPGPFIRVTAGTEIRATVHNRLAKPLLIRGLQDHASATLDTFDIPAGGSREIAFRATSAGTFMYWGRTEGTRVNFGRGLDVHLVGAFIVDPVGTPPPRGERTMVITSFWDTLRVAGRPPVFREVLAINGKSWPYTERLQYGVGDTVRWRIINGGDNVHPMHLHGFYYTVLSRGDAIRDTIFTDRQQRKSVTEFMRGGQTMTMKWVPTRPGNWLFHCHLIYHIDPELRVGDAAPHTMDGRATGHAEQMMAGLVMGIFVPPTPGVALAVDPVPRRRLRMFVDQRAGVFGDKPGFSYILQQGDTPPARDSVQFPSSTLVLNRDEPTEITVINRTTEEASIHWHGIELGSFYDGVGGWSGWDTRRAPVMAPGDSFIVRMTPDRAGTFIYHTHTNETVQLNSGLYGAILVLPPGGTPDPNERLFLIGAGGPQSAAPQFINGSADVKPVDITVNTAHRFRFINITAANLKRIRLLDSADKVVRWRAVAKDGADLPPAQAIDRTAETFLGIGETMDFEVLRPSIEPLILEIGSGTKFMRIPVRIAPR